MGALFAYPVVQTTFEAFTAWVHANQYTVYGTSAQGSTLYSDVQDFLYPSILLMGSEREGLSEAQRAICHLLLSLPMLGKASSLNLAVATGVLLYTMLEAQGE